MSIMNREGSLVAILATGLFAVNGFAGEVWMRTALIPHSAATNLSTWAKL